MKTFFKIIAKQVDRLEPGAILKFIMSLLSD